MALANNTDTERAALRLGESIARHLDGPTDVRVTNIAFPDASGMSNETLMFDASWETGEGRVERPLVARVAPSGPAVFVRYDLGLEARVISTLAEQTDVPVPRVYVHEADESVLGAPFVVMERVAGRVPTDDPPFSVAGWVTELTPEQRGALIDNSLQAIAKLHAVDWRAVGLGDLEAHPEAGIDGQLNLWRKSFVWAAEGGRNPVIEAGFDWLDAHRPESPGPQVLTWGDARIGNTIFGDDLSVAALLDWEMLSIANPEADLAWSVFMFDHFTSGIGVPVPEGFPSRESVIARYEELTGHQVVDFEFYEVLAATRVAVLMHRAANLMILAGQIPPDATMALNNPATQMLAGLLGLPRPDGTASSFIGNR